MNADVHALIFRSAFAALPVYWRDQLSPTDKLLYDAPNYPDYFDDPTRPEDNKQAIDPDWRRFCRLNSPYSVTKWSASGEDQGNQLITDQSIVNSLDCNGMHFWPTPLEQQYDRIPLYQYYFDRMDECLAIKDYASFLKFAGCLSHAMGDLTQPAHLGGDPNNVFISQLLPKPDLPYLTDFHYHTTVEAVCGDCEELQPAENLGLSSNEAAWKLAGKGMQAIIHCRRYIVPLIQALFTKCQESARKAATPAVTMAAQLTLDAMYSVLMRQDKNNASQDCSPVDLRIIPTLREQHDLVYGGMILDGNKDVPPNNVPTTAGSLLVDQDKIDVFPGFGMLPHSGMSWGRWAYSTWRLPAGVFSRFTSLVGMNNTLSADGAVEFIVELDNVPVWTSGRMTKDTVAKNVDILLTNATELTLKVIDANDGKSFWKNHAYWACPRLNR